MFNRDLYEDATQVANIDAGKIDVFTTNPKNTKSINDELNLMGENINISWKNNGYTKNRIKQYIKQELAEIDITKYHQYDITRTQLDDKEVSIQLGIWDYQREDPNCYECVGYSKEEIENVMDTYIDIIKSHFEKLGIRITNDRTTTQWNWRY